MPRSIQVGVPSGWFRVTWLMPVKVDLDTDKTRDTKTRDTDRTRGAGEARGTGKTGGVAGYGRDVLFH